MPVPALDLVLPGPTPMHPEVQQAVSEPLLHHESPEFHGIMADTLDGVRWLFGTEREPLLTTGSTSSALTMAIMNATRPGDELIMVVGGYFAERWARAADALGRRVRRVCLSDGQMCEPNHLTDACARWPEARLVCLVHCETSTGAISDVETLAEVVRGCGRLLAVDAATSVGVRPLEVDAWGLDIVVAGIQKALGCPPGLAITTLSERALADATPGLPDDMHWATLLGHQPHNGFYTPALTQWRALHAALRVLRSEGLGVHQLAASRRAQRVRAWAQQHEVPLISPDDLSSASLTVLEWENAPEAQQWVRDRAQARIALGIGEHRHRRLRIGHLGWTSDEATERVLDALGTLRARRRRHLRLVTAGER